jgi:Predicted metal-dependent hydrolase
VKFIDVTRALSAHVPLYPGDDPPVIIPQDHGTYRTTRLTLSSHHGTHIDAPSHFLPGGLSVDRLPMSYLIGPCQVLDVRDAGDRIPPEDIIPRLDSCTRLLLRTRASEMARFGPSFPCLQPDAARALVGRGLRCVGIDSPSVEEYPGDGSVHRTLLAHPTVIIELLDLSHTAEGIYDMIALPLRLEGVEGSPARVILCGR